MTLHDGFGLAAALNLKSIARGVDNDAQREALAGRGCDEGIGQLFGELTLPQAAQKPAPRPGAAGRPR